MMRRMITPLSRAIAFIHRKHWWIMTFLGSFLALTIAAAFVAAPYRPLLGGVGCLGLGLLLGVLAFVATPWGQLRWLAPPALVLQLLGLLLLKNQLELFNAVWPAALVLGVLYLLACVLRWSHWTWMCLRI
jgi:hypothetical protein